LLENVSVIIVVKTIVTMEHSMQSRSYIIYIFLYDVFHTDLCPC